MPESEMLLWIALEGDEVVAQTAQEVHTKKGWRFVRCREGTEMRGDTWYVKWRWMCV